MTKKTAKNRGFEIAGMTTEEKVDGEDTKQQFIKEKLEEPKKATPINDSY